MLREDNTCMPESTPATLATISRNELKQKLDRHDHFLLVETLAPEYYNHSHLPGALNLPPDQVRELAPTLLPDKTADIVVYCAKPT
jgi:rhodanese-related sulfurtransferase